MISSCTKNISLFLVIILLTLSGWSQSVTTVAGTGTTASYVNNIPGIEATVNNPTAIVTDINGDVFFVDQGNAAIRKIEIATGMITEFYPILFGYPVGGVVSNNDDTLYFTINTGSSNLLWWYDVNTATNGSLAQLTYESTGLCVSGDSIFITSQTDHIVTLYVISTATESVYAGTPSSAGFNGNNVAANDALLDSPTDILLGNDNNLYVCDKGNNRIRKIDRSNNDTITTFAGNGSQGFNGNGISATVASLNLPEGIAKSLDGTIYIADTENNMIRRIAPGTGVIESVAGNGNAGFVDNTSGDLAEFNRPIKLNIAPNGIIYVSDNENERIRAIEYCTVADVPTILTSTNEYSVCPDESLLLFVAPMSNLNDQKEWVWYKNDCGQDFISEGDTIEVSSNDIGDYTVRGEGNCYITSGCAIINIGLADCSSETYYNSFSPNDDGVNDTWEIPLENQSVNVLIYNRWGDLVKTVENYDNVGNVWDGRNVNLEKVSPGTYFYIIEDSNNNTLKSGWVQVIR